MTVPAPWQLNEMRLQAILAACRHKPPQVFVETGTFLGDRTAMARPFFRETHSIELSRELFQAAMERFFPDTAELAGDEATGVMSPETEDHRLILHHGDSRVILPDICRHTPEPICFYLDSNWWRSTDPRVAGKDLPNALGEELQAVAQRKSVHDVVIIQGADNLGRVSALGRDRRHITRDVCAGLFPGAQIAIMDNFLVVYR